MKRFLVFALFVINSLCAQTNISGTINSYAAVTNIDIQSCVSNNITVDDATGFSIGDTVLIIQMQGATIDVSNSATFGDVTNIGNAGNYEKNYISAISGNVISLGFQLVNTYDVAGKVQIVNIPHYIGNVNVNGVLTAMAWNGSKGGVLAFSCSGDVTMSSNINVSGLGFRGGGIIPAPTVGVSQSCGFLGTDGCVGVDYFYNSTSVYAVDKGEGVSVLNANYQRGKGKNANGGGGGGIEAGGGGGGANIGNGGYGGGCNQKSCPTTLGCSCNASVVAGLGAIGLSYGSKLFLGGGSGAGNNGNGNQYYNTPYCLGLNGGGIIYIKANQIIGNTNSITAQGIDGVDLSASGAGTMGTSGGGGGGSILLDANNIDNVIINANGGRGNDSRKTSGSSNATGGSGGGGGGGLIAYTGGSFGGTVTTNINGGIAGNSYDREGDSRTAPYKGIDGTNGSIIFNYSFNQSTTPISSGTPLNAGTLTTPIDICENANYTFTSNADNGLNYQWQINNAGTWTNLTNTGIYSGTTTQNTFTISSVPASIDGNSYRLKVYSTCDSAFTNATQINILNLPIINTQPISDTICPNSNAFFFSSATNSTSFQWQILDGTWQNLSNGANIIGADNDSLYLNNVPNAYDGKYFKVVASNSCGTTYSDSASITFSNTAISTTVSLDTLNVCTGNDSIIYLNTAGNIDSIQWQENQGSGFVNLVNNADFQGVHNDTLSFISISNTETGYTYRALLFDACGNSFISDTTTIQVYESPSVSINPTINACEGQGIFVSISNQTGSNISYQWQVDSTGGTWENLTNTNGYSNTTGNFLGFAGSIVNSTLNSHLYRVAIQTDCGAATSNSLQITVIDHVDIIVQANNDTVCISNNASFTINVNNVAGYQWQSNESGSFANLSNNVVYSGVNTATLNIANVSAIYSTYQYRVVLTGNNPCGAANSQAVSIYLSTEDSIIAQSNNLILCQNEDTFVYVQSTNNGNYQWQVGNGTSYTNISNTANYTGSQNDTLLLNNIPFSFNNNYYRAIFTDYCGTNDTSNAIHLTVNQYPSVINEASNKTICLGESVSFSIEGSASTSTFQWQVDNGGGFTNILNNSVYFGSNTDSLYINNPSASYNNYMYRAILNNSCGSDTSLHYVLQINTIPTFTYNQTICVGDTMYLSDGTALTASGIYNDTLYNATSNGCDSIYQVALTVIPTPSFTNNQSICQNESYTLPSGNTVSMAGTYTDTLFNQAANGCDSIVTTNLSVLAIPTLSFTDSFCTNTPYTLPSGNTVSSGGVYNDTLYNQATNGCDSVNIITLNENQTYPPFIVNDTICANTNYTLPNGNIVSNTGTYTDTIQTLNGCDSIWIINLYHKPTNSITNQSTSLRYCLGDNLTLFATSQLSNVSYQWQENGINLTGATNDTLVLSNVLAAQSGNTYQLYIYSECDTVASNLISINEKQGVSYTSQLENDTVCEQENVSFTITLSGSPLQIEWYENNLLINNATGSTLNITNVNATQNGNFYYTALTDSCGNIMYSDTAILFVNSLPQITEGPLNQTVCVNNDFYFYVTSANYNSIQWYENGNILPFHQADTMLMVNAASNMNGNTYYCEINNSCGIVTSQTFTISVEEDAYIINQTDEINQCGGFSFSMFVETNIDAVYQWQADTGSGYFNIIDGYDTASSAFLTGTNNDTLTVSNYNEDISNAIFRVEIINLCDTNVLSAPIHINISTPSNMYLGIEDTSICLSNNIPILVNTLPNDALWSNGDIGQVFLPEQTGYYTVSYMDSNNCPQKDSVYVDIIDCLANCAVFMPTGFSPNNSGVNDVLKAIYNCNIDFFEFSIYNRYGEKVFYTNDYTIGWDGTYRGKDAEIGIYTWHLEYKFTDKTTTEFLTGNTTLIR